MKILLKTFHLKYNGVLYHPGDEVVINQKQYEALAEDRAGAFAVVEEAKAPEAETDPEPVTVKKKTTRAKK